MLKGRNGKEKRERKKEERRERGEERWRKKEGKKGRGFQTSSQVEIRISQQSQAALCPSPLPPKG